MFDAATLTTTTETAGNGTGPDLSSYDVVAVAFSGGKDSLACVAALLEAGVPASKIELHHHDVDGGAETFMDWTITPAYCRAVAAALDMPIYFSWKDGGFQREMDRKDSATAPIVFETPNEGVKTAGGKGPAGTRGVFPQVSPDLSVRWCSSYLKIDVMAASIRNQDRFLGKRTLVVTGERAQESSARAKYKIFETHRTDTRDGTRKARHVDVWRPVHAWSEAQVWDAIKRLGVVAHPAYHLGWGRLSCMTCIFGSANQWATIAAVFPDRFETIAAKEEGTGKTIQRAFSIRKLAARGTPFAAAIANPALVEVAKGDVWTGAVRVSPTEWVLPAGAFGDNAGPC